LACPKYLAAFLHLAVSPALAGAAMSLRGDLFPARLTSAPCLCTRSSLRRWAALAGAGMSLWGIAYILARLQDCAAFPRSAATFTRKVAECQLSAVVAQATCRHFCATPRMSRGNKARISQRCLKTTVLSSLRVLGWSGITSRISSPWRAKRVRSVCAPKRLRGTGLPGRERA